MLMAALTGVFPASAADSNTTDYGCNAPADSSTPGVDGFTAPAPRKLDASGTDQDGYCIPDDFIHPWYGFGSYYVDDEAQMPGFHATNGAQFVMVTSNYDSGAWTFNFTDTDVGTEAKNKYRVVVSDVCRRSQIGDSYREVTAYFTNVADTTGRYVNSIFPQVFRADGVAGSETEYAQNIADGETAVMRVMHFEGSLPGLVPGKYKVRFWRADEGYATSSSKAYIVKRMKLTVPRCGKPHHATPVREKASGSLKRVGCHRVKVVADARGYSATPKAQYRVVKKLKSRKARTRSFGVAAGHRRAFSVKKPRYAKGPVVLKVKRGNGWVMLDRAWLPRCR